MHAAIRVATAAAVLAAGMIAFPSSAEAMPSYCQGRTITNGATVYCYSGAAGTQFRAVVTCRHYTPTGSTDDYKVYGPWRIQGNPLWSSAACPGGDFERAYTAGLR